MSFEYIRTIPKAESILSEMPLSKDLAQFKEQRDHEVIAVINCKSDKFLVIIGPCSADNEDAVCEYVSRLARLQAQVKNRLILIPRVYTNKPRTTGEGYKGMGHQPDPNDEPNMAEGIRSIRRMHIRALQESHLTSADEMLYPGNYPYLADVLSYVAIGARSVENQEHRLTVSGLDIPAGMKNPTSGDFTVMLNSIQAAQTGHVFVYNGWEAKTSGNPYAHAILRGAVDYSGRSIPNYHYEDMLRLAEMYAKRNLANPTVIVDTNHANSNKKYGEQPHIAMEVVYSVRNSSILRSFVKGVMIESYLIEGSQSVTGKTFGQSITDPCLGWDDSEKLVLKIADYISRS
jgi:3-deoxy-7-phosphoheptulonate synthase